MIKFGTQDSSAAVAPSYLQHYFNNIKFTGDVEFFTYNTGSMNLKVGVITKDGIEGKVAINSYAVNPSNSKSIRHVAETLAVLAHSLGGDELVDKVNVILGDALVDSGDAFGCDLKDKTSEFLSSMVEDIIKLFAETDKYCWIAIKGRESADGKKIFCDGMISFPIPISDDKKTKVNIGWTVADDAVTKTVVEDGLVVKVFYFDKKGNPTSKEVQDNDFWLEKAEVMDSSGGLDSVFGKKTEPVF